jgi:hypothetical protein
MRPHGYDLKSLVQVGRGHWRVYLPEKFKHLTDAGTLEAELKAAAELTIAEMDDLRTAGYQLHEAWAMARETHLILPEEQSEEEPMPDNPAFDAIADCNRVLRQLGNE